MLDTSSPFHSHGLKLITYCPLCRTHYSIRDAKILEEREDSHLMHIVCRRCSSSILVLMLIGELGVSSVGMVTDLTSDDVLRFKGVLPVTDDDVLCLHEYLQQEEFPLAE
ncbi:MAG: hypothetical protein V1685_06435 [Parcubacteria group bacterium]